MELQTSVKELLAILETIASFDLAESWDNVGLMVGKPEEKVTGIFLALDPTEQVLDEAVAAGVNTIITHHPLIFHPLKSIRTDHVIGRFLMHAMAENIAVIGCHTNLDIAHGGVNDALAATLELTDVIPLTLKESVQTGKTASSDGDDHGDITLQGFGRIGTLVPSLKSEAFLQHVSKKLSLSALAVAGVLPPIVETVALCGGSGSDLAEVAHLKGADVYITGEVKHSTARWAEASNFCIIDAGHFATENPVIDALSATLKNVFAEKKVSLDVLTTTKQKDPFYYYHQ